ncbi:MAG: sugar phosphate isomerase/epimerase [Acidobacteriota bacterium]
MITRRSFIAGIAGSAMVLNARRLRDIGLQLYTVRTELKKDFDGTIAKVASIGYSEVEFAGYYERPAAEIKRLLDRYKLKSPATHIPLQDLRSDLPKAIETAKTIGHHYIVCPWLEPSERRTLDDYRKHAAFFNQAGEACRKAGLQFGYHNHDFEFSAIEGQLPYDLLLKETDPQLVKMELDLYWIARGGQDASKYFEKHPGRFELAHVKDLAKTADQAAVEAGRGTLNFKTLLDQSVKAGVRHFFVEQDEPTRPLESIKISFDYLRLLDY